MGWLASIGRYHTRNVFLSRNFLPLDHDDTHFEANFLDFRPSALALLWFQRVKSNNNSIVITFLTNVFIIAKMTSYYW